jgi:tetratricopeptide (TPR) repeat protein
VARTRVARIRDLTQRGRFVEAQTLIDELFRQPHQGVEDEYQAALIELARIQYTTDQQRFGSATAEAVVRHYEGRGLGDHQNALLARIVLAEADVTLHLTELRADPARWPRALKAMKALRDRFRDTHGLIHTLTVAAWVSYGYALVSSGESATAQDELTKAAECAAERFGVGHPLYLRAMFLLGQAYAQLDHYPAARARYQTAFTGQHRVLGPVHPDTLHSQFQLGVALKMLGESRRARDMFRAVRAAAPRSVGTATDLNGMAWFAGVLVYLPRWLWRLSRSK